MKCHKCGGPTIGDNFKCDDCRDGITGSNNAGYVTCDECGVSHDGRSAVCDDCLADRQDNLMDQLRKSEIC